MLCSRRFALGFAVLAGVLSSTAAAQAPHFRLEGELPFSAAELQAAAELRVPGWQDLQPGTLVVRGRAAGEVELELRGWRRALPLGDAHGGEAARLVALALADLMLAVASGARGVDSERPRVVPASRAAGSGEPPFTRIALAAVAGRGLGALEPWNYGLALAVSRAYQPWLLDVELGLALAPARELAPLRTSWSAARLRVQAGVRVARFMELLAGPALVPLWVSGGDGFFGVLPAFGFAARAVVRLGPGLDGVLAAGADLFVRRVQLQAYGMDAIATPRLAPWLGLALGWRSP